MATSTLIQSLDVVDSAGGAVGASPSNRSQVETFIAGSAVAIGDWVTFDTSKTGATKVVTVIPSVNVPLGSSLVVGVATEAASTGGKVKVVVSGYVGTAKVVAGVAGAGVPLCVVASAPSAEANVAANIAPPVGVSLAASAAGVAPVWVFKKF